jgi:hypothetical protein
MGLRTYRNIAWTGTHTFYKSDGTTVLFKIDAISNTITFAYEYKGNTVTDANYTILDGDGYEDIDFDPGASDRVCNLPDLASNLGRKIRISKITADAGKVTITCAGADKFLAIGSPTTLDLNDIGDTAYLLASPTGWKII